MPSREIFASLDKFSSFFILLLAATTGEAGYLLKSLVGFISPAPCLRSFVRPAPDLTKFFLNLLIASVSTPLGLESSGSSTVLSSFSISLTVLLMSSIFSFSVCLFNFFFGPLLTHLHQFPKGLHSVPLLHHQRRLQPRRRPLQPRA